LWQHPYSEKFRDKKRDMGAPYRKLET